MLKFLLYCLIVVVALAFVFGGYLWSKNASHNRNWLADYQRLPSFAPDDSGNLTLSNLRAFSFRGDGAAQHEWKQIKLDSRKLVELWYFIEPFESDKRFAHAWISFVFADDEGHRHAISVSVEARREKHEEYSALWGAMREFELIYIWSEEKDAMTRVALSIGGDIIAYKADLDKEAIKTIFDHFVTRTNAIAKTPRFYNTLTSNCTNELAKAVNDAFPGTLPWHRSWLATGESAAWLFDLGFLTSYNLDFQTLTQRSHVQETIGQISDLDPETFSTAWRQQWRKGLDNPD